MTARHYLSPLLPAGRSFAGAMLRISSADGAESSRAYADPELRSPLSQPVLADASGRFPPIHLDPRVQYRVALLSAAGAEVASHTLAAGTHGTRPDADDAGLFTDLTRLALPAGVTRVRTEGWSTRGLGAGEYVADALATTALASAHPRFCACLSDGRCFRLEGTGGLITVEQGGASGDPNGTGQANDGPAFEAAIAYAAAVGIARIGLTQTAYSVHAPVRHSGPKAQVRALDGHPIVVPAGAGMHLVGLTHAPSRIVFHAPGGASFDGARPGKAFQIIDGQVWRGAGFYIPGNGPIAYQGGSRSGGPRPRITFEHLIVDGGTKQSGKFVIPADPADGGGWDVTHKGVWVEPDRRGVAITIIDCTFTGWRGETVYASNDPGAKLIVRNARFTQSNGQGLNANGCQVDIDGCVISGCYMGIEGWTGARGGRIVDTRIVACGGVPGKSGAAFALQGGSARRSARSTFNAPGRVDGGEDPIGQIDITCQACEPALIGWWLHGRIKLIDTKLIVGAFNAFNEGSQQIDLDIALVTDQTGASIVIAGGSGKPGDRLTDNVTLRVTSSATAAALRANRRPEALIVWRGSLGEHIAITIDGRAALHPPRADGAAPDAAPRIRDGTR